MNFYMSKENIQPLRGGRNVSQLGLALQAESGSEEIRRELNQQRELYINVIKNYEGNDPLENWYRFISWIEQSYPKNGHEGNLIPLLEECLKKFENDSRYVNDARFCKLWIKFIDMQSNPIELYQMMYTKRICIGCADLYKAWAYYHEAVNDFKSADAVFESGMKQLAQPFEELKLARENLVMAAGSHMLYGRDERKLIEKRQALTSLVTSKHGKVGSIRISSRSGVPTIPCSSDGSTRLNSAPVVVYESPHNEEQQGAVAAPSSILVAVKRNEAPKENTLKAGPWNTAGIGKKKTVVQHHPAPFTVHEDDPNDYNSLRSEPINFPPKTEESLEDWSICLTMPEVYDPKWHPQYPKSRVYVGKMEYSLEELRAVRYRKKKRQIQEQPEEIFMVTNSLTPNRITTQQTSFQNSPNNNFIPMETNQCVSQRFEVYTSPVLMQSQEALAPVCVSDQIGGAINSVPNLMVVESVPVNEHNLSFQQLVYGNVVQASPPKKVAGFVPYEQSDLQADVQPKGSAMKTPFRDLNADDLAETGSQGSRGIPMAAQPVQSAVVEIDDDNDQEVFAVEDQLDIVDLNTNQFNFNLSAMKVSTPQTKHPSSENNCFQVKRSPEVTKPPMRKLFVYEDDNNCQQSNPTPSSCRKSLMPVGLSTIEEESKISYASSSGSCNTIMKSCLSTRQTGGLEAISEEHKSYLSQNMMANEALRRSLLGDFLPTGGPPVVTDSNDVDMRSNPESRSSSPVVGDYPVSDTVPSDPFRSTEIQKLLKLVNFPGPHGRGLYYVPSIPNKVFARKDMLVLGDTQYAFDKILGKGTFGKVYKALNIRNNNEVALKFQRPTNKWEFYICRELQARLANQSLKDRFMNITKAFFSDQMSVLEYAYKPFGSLLDLANQVKRKSGKHMQECLVFYFSIEMLSIVEALHSAKIIHADIKPDNFLVQLSPDNTTLELQLIDFGCSIDMSLYPPNASFTKQVTTENFICCEMKEGKPWNYHTDLFCVAASTHVLLFDKYLEVQQQFDVWAIKEKLPRYMNRDVWTKFFNILLNRQSEAKMLQTELDNALSHVYEKFSSGMKNLINLVKNR